MNHRISPFNSPLMLGFEHFERMLERAAKASGDSYPPYNIEQIGDSRLRITLAVAGFSEDDLSITLEESQLIIRGNREDEADRVFLHRGIAARQFQKTFVLAEGIEVEKATLDSGLLHIDLKRIAPEKRIRTIKITSARTD